MHSRPPGKRVDPRIVKSEASSLEKKGRPRTRARKIHATLRLFMKPIQLSRPAISIRPIVHVKARIAIWTSRQQLGEETGSQDSPANEPSLGDGRSDGGKCQWLANSQRWRYH